MLQSLKNMVRKNRPQPTELGPVEAYDIWAENYDAQPGNLMLVLDEKVFSNLLSGVNIGGKQVADIGCGTGRHWQKLFSLNTASLTGFDVSQKMLDRLQEKFPQAKTVQITDDSFPAVADASFDVIVSTLTVAHIEDIEEAMNAWSRILKPKAEIIITDFHPEALAYGGKRTFGHKNGQIAVRNFVHHVATIERLLVNRGFHRVMKDERIVDQSMKHYYAAQKALPVYEKFEGSKIIYGIHLKRG